jgi:tetratricopeptide (TPR) repeat protein
VSLYSMRRGDNLWSWKGRWAVKAVAVLLVGLLPSGCSQHLPLNRAAASAPALDMEGNVRIWTDRLSLPTYDVRSDPVPRFQATDDAKFYPYPAQRAVADQPVVRPWTVIHLENKYLKVEILPELGGRVFRLYDKLAGQEMVYPQASIKPVLAGVRGAWVAGGIEFNFPDCHSVTTHDQVHWTTRQYPDGSMSVLIGDVERISRMGWTVELRLCPDRACLEDRVYLMNRTPIRQRCFYWTNAAVVGTDRVQMILPAPKVTMGQHGKEPVDWPLRDGTDYSWLTGYEGGTAVMGVGGEEDFVAAYDHARQVGLVHYADRGALPARKFWTWGAGPLSDYWGRRVSQDNKPYLEMQAGPQVSLSELAWMQPYEVVRFDECWIPVSRIGPVARANPDASVRLTVEKPRSAAAQPTIEKSLVTLGVLVTERIAAAQVELRGRWKTIWHSQADLSPETPLLQTVPVGLEDLDSLRLVVTDSRGQVVIEHAYGHYARQAKVPAEVPDIVGRRVDASTVEGAVQRFEVGWMECRYADAVRTVEQALARWPDDPLVRFEVGVLRLWQGRPAEALALLQPASRQIDSIGMQARYYAALASLRRGDLEKASAMLAPMEKLDPKSPDMVVWRRAGTILRAKVLLSAGQFHEAYNLLQAVLRTDADDSYVAALSVYALRHAGRADAALRLVRRYLARSDLEPMARLEAQVMTRQADPALERMLLRDPEVGIELACDYISIADWSTAETILTGGLGANARSGMTWLLAGHCAEVMGRMDAAAAYRAKAEVAPVCLTFPSRIEELAAAEHALQAEPQSPRAAYYAGLILMRLMRYDEAIGQWERAIAIRDDNPVARRCLGMVLARVKQKPAEAIVHLERAVALAPGEGSLYLDLADLHADLGHRQEQREVLQRALRNSPASDDLVSAMGEAYLAMGDYRQAAATLDGRTFNPAQTHYNVFESREVAWLGVGLQRLLQDDSEAALEAFNQALAPPATLPAEPRHEPDAVAMIQFWRAAALRALGRPGQAQQALEQAARQATDPGALWGGYYSVMNVAHGVLALQMLGEAKESARLLGQLREPPPQRKGRRSGQSDWMRAYMTFRAAWGRTLQEGGAAGEASFEQIAADRSVPTPWGRLSILAAEALKRQVPAPATRKVANDE